MMLTSISIPFPPEYYKEFVVKNNTSARELLYSLFFIIFFIIFGGKRD